VAVSGEGYGVVVRTGDHTFIGQIASLTGASSGKRSPLAEEIAVFVKIISTIAIGTAILFFIHSIASVYKGRAAATVTFAISILIAWVPEGLPATVTLLLSIAAKRMAARNVLVKNLQGVEVLSTSFKPNLVRVQKAQTADPSVRDFLSSSPPFTTSSGRVLSADDQVDAWARSQSIMYMSIFVIQCFNIFACKAKFLPPFGWHVVSNVYNFYSSWSFTCLLFTSCLVGRTSSRRCSG